jgi:hypothetical protein
MKIEGREIRDKEKEKREEKIKKSTRRDRETNAEEVRFGRRETEKEE